MTVTFDSSILLAYYQAKNAQAAKPAAGSSTTKAGMGDSSPPTAPWSTTSSAPHADALAKSVLAGGKFIDPNAAQLDVKSKNPDYKPLFALYQGLNALEALSEQITAKGVGDAAKARLQSTFNRGVSELQSFIADGPFESFSVALGTVAAKVQSSVGTDRAADGYQTGVLHTGSLSTEVDAFTGPVQFSMNVVRSGVSKTVDFDLSEMGATPRTMSNVVLYLNDKLAAAGTLTRFSNVRIPGQPITTTSGKQTITVGTSADTFALKVKTDSAETVSFSAPTSAPAVYVGGLSGIEPPKTTTTGAPAPAADPNKPAVVNQLTKFETDGAGLATNAADGKVSTDTLGPQVVAMRSSVTAPDGSLYVLAEVNAGVDGETIKGANDVALLKYDSAGALLYSRSLGAATDAQGYALTVSADGSQVAVGGQVTGALNAGETIVDPKAADSFVTVYNAAGEEQWSQRNGALSDDKVTGLAFAADGSLYATGSTSSTLPGQTWQGGQSDNYLRGFSATGKVTFTTEFGSTGVDKSASLVVDGSSVVVAGVENGDAVLRRFDLQPTGAPVLASQRNLGGLGGGDLAGVALAADGSVVLAGSTKAALSAGGANNSYDGIGSAGFVANVAADLSGSADHLTYLDAAGNRTLSAFTVSGGKVYVTGQQAAPLPPGQTKADDGYVSVIDPQTGAVSWTTTIKGEDRESAPTTIAVSQTGASVLDRLGLPTGKLNQAPSNTLVANTAVRVGDQFSIQQGGVTTKITIEATDTLKTLATKISRATGFTVTPQITVANGRNQLSLKPANPRAEIQIEAGPAGRDALEALGIPEGIVSNDPTNARDALAAKTKPTYALGLSSTMNLSDDTSAKQATTALLAAATKVRSMYSDIVSPPSTSTTVGKQGGTVPAYLTNQIANYQLALARLTGTTSA